MRIITYFSQAVADLFLVKKEGEKIQGRSKETRFHAEIVNFQLPQPRTFLAGNSGIDEQNAESCGTHVAAAQCKPKTIGCNEIGYRPDRFALTAHKRRSRCVSRWRPYVERHHRRNTINLIAASTKVKIFVSARAMIKQAPLMTCYGRSMSR